MNLDRLRTYAALIEEGTFSAAARACGVSQPAVSQGLKSLERELGISLVDRSGDRTLPTAAGQLLYARARRLIDSWDETRAALQDFQKEPRGEVAIGGSTIPAEYLLPRLLAEFQKHYPKVTPHVLVAGTAEIVERIRTGKLDVAVAGAPADKGLVSFPIARDELQMIVPLAHPFAHRGELVRRDLIGAPLIVREGGSDTRRAMEQALSRCEVPQDRLRIVGTFGSTEAVIAAVEAGLGISFVSQWAAERAVRGGRVAQIAVPCLKLTRQLYCVYKEVHALHSPTRELVDFLRTRGS